MKQRHSPDLFDQLSGLSDDVCSCEANDASHLHGVPASPVGHRNEDQINTDQRSVVFGQIP